MRSPEDSGQRQNQEEGVDTVQEPSEARQPGAGVLDPGGAFDEGLQKIPQDPAQTDGDHQTGSDVAQQGEDERGPEDCADQSTERLIRRQGGQRPPRPGHRAEEGAACPCGHVGGCGREGDEKGVVPQDHKVRQGPGDPY